MPAKVARAPRRAPAARAPRAAAAAVARVSREPSVARAATPDDPPAPEAEPEPEPYTPLQKTIATIFSQAQKTTAGHRKLVINLRSVFDQCIAGTGSIGSTIGTKGRQGEKLFTRDFCRFLNRVLVVKKSEVVGDRCLRLADLFVKNLVDGGKDKKKKQKHKEPESKDADGDVEMGVVEEQEPEVVVPEEGFVETSATRVVLRILNHIVPFLSSKERGTRYRTAQFIALLLSNSLPTFPFDYANVSLSIFRQVLAGLTKRIHDKEAIVRVQAAIGLVRLLEMGVSAGSDAEEDSDEEEESQDGIIGVLIEAMQNDPSADVRRTILYNLSPTPATLPYLLERSRDIDPATRRAVFTRLLPTLGDFRHLSIGMREKLLRWGLNDRDESVRKAAKNMFNFRWVDDAQGDLLEVLERLDVTSEGIEGGPKYLALKGFWENRKDVLADLTFSEEFWENLTPEGSFLARSFNDYCRSALPQEAKGLDVDERMPEATRLAFYLQRYLNKLVMTIRSQEEEDEASDIEFIVQQLLLIAMSMDYGDEIGRRKMFALLRESLGIIELSEPVTKLIVDGLRKLSMGEGDFCLLILEVIAQVHDTIAEDDDDGESFHSAHSDPEEDDEEEQAITVRPKTQARPSSGEVPAAKKQKINKRQREDDDDEVEMMDADPEEDIDEEEELRKAMKELTVNLKCLHIAQCMLENVEGGLQTNTHLITMLNGLVVPAVRSHEAPVREGGLHCLGLSCLLDKALAEENLTLFAHCFNKGHDKLQIEALHIISDILLTHGATIFAGEACNVDQRQLYRMLAKATKMDENEEVQATAVEVICKLMLAQVIQDEELLKVLVTSYFDPATTRNHSLRQTLSYFLPVFCHSSPKNALTMASIAVAEFHTLLVLRASLDEGEDMEMVSPATIAAHLVEWTDSRKAAPAAVKEPGWALPHAVVARDVLERVCVVACPKEERKLLVNSLLAKCVISKDAGREVLKEVYDAVVEAIEAKVVGEAAGRNVLGRVEVAVGKVLAEIQEEEGEEEAVAPRDGGDDDDEEEEEGEAGGEGEATVPQPVLVEEEGEGGGEESEHTPAVTEDEDEEEDM